MDRKEFVAISRSREVGVEINVAALRQALGPKNLQSDTM